MFGTLVLFLVRAELTSVCVCVHAHSISLPSTSIPTSTDLPSYNTTHHNTMSAAAEAEKAAPASSEHFAHHALCEQGRVDSSTPGARRGTASSVDGATTPSSLQRDRGGGGEVPLKGHEECVEGDDGSQPEEEGRVCDLPEGPWPDLRDQRHRRTDGGQGRTPNHGTVRRTGRRPRPTASPTQVFNMDQELQSSSSASFSAVTMGARSCASFGNQNETEDELAKLKQELANVKEEKRDLELQMARHKGWKET